MEVRTSPGRRTLTLPLSGGLATTAATRAGRPLDRGLTKRSGTKPDTIFSSGAGSTKRIVFSVGDMPGLTSHVIHTRCPTLKGIDSILQQ